LPAATRTFTSKLSFMLGTQRKGPAEARPKSYSSPWEETPHNYPSRAGRGCPELC